LAENEAYEIERIKFSDLNDFSGPKIDQKMLADIPIEATVELGKTKITLKDVLDLAEGSIIELDKISGEPLDIKVGGQIVARGEVVAVDDYYGIRITKVLIK